MSALYGSQIQLKPTEAFLNYWPYYSYSPFYRHSQTFDQYKYGLMNDWYFKTPYHCHSYLCSLTEDTDRRDVCC
ncbi:hypothetical protein niasHS_013605 [Heterodera schachtii]|uniref:Uncharacterized protein n=1 Tax=Heterodera schachtii TaxID=97005 RepID=A0ABD2I7C2_HETSC